MALIGLLVAVTSCEGLLGPDELPRRSETLDRAWLRRFILREWVYEEVRP